MIAALGPEAVARIVKTIAVYDDFCQANDPYGEHDFGSFEADGQLILFKIDYFDKARASSQPFSIVPCSTPSRPSWIDRRKLKRPANQGLRHCLMGRIFDDARNRMTPTHARKRGVKYRYYLSSALLNGEAERTGSVSRLPAAALEAVVIRSVREHLKSPAAMNDRSLIETHIARVEVHPERLIIRFAQGERAANDPAGPENTLSVRWQKTAATRRREILLPEGVSPQNVRRIRCENRTTLLASIARGRRWLEELVIEPTATAETIAKREGCTARKVNMTISLAFLAPGLIKAAIDGTLPHGMGVVRLADLPAEWSQQHQMLGLPWS
jgi:site-specific DNA recombinase